MLVCTIGNFMIVYLIGLLTLPVCWVGWEIGKALSIVNSKGKG
jgi:hypothetical protein